MHLIPEEGQIESKCSVDSLLLYYIINYIIDFFELKLLTTLDLILIEALS